MFEVNCEWWDDETGEVHLGWGLENYMYTYTKDYTGIYFICIYIYIHTHIDRSSWIVCS